MKRGDRMRLAARVEAGRRRHCQAVRRRAGCEDVSEALAGERPGRVAIRPELIAARERLRFWRQLAERFRIIALLRPSRVSPDDERKAIAARRKHHILL